MLNNNKLYDNADSFSMAFDEAWVNSDITQKKAENKDEKLDRILDIIKEHPFLINSPIEARRVANFRIRLLKLQ